MTRLDCKRSFNGHGKQALDLLAYMCDKLMALKAQRKSNQGEKRKQFNYWSGSIFLRDLGTLTEKKKQHIFFHFCELPKVSCFPFFTQEKKTSIKPLYSELWQTAKRRKQRTFVSHQQEMKSMCSSKSVQRTTSCQEERERKKNLCYVIKITCRAINFISWKKFSLRI